MEMALFFNAVPEIVLAEILESQAARAGGESFLQKESRIIRPLQERLPTPNSPIRLYASTTKKLSIICYTAEIIRWEVKREMSRERHDEVLRHFEIFQPKEREKFLEQDKINLITIRNLRNIETLVPTNFLVKKNGSPLGEMRSPGWAEVYNFGDLMAIETEETSNRRLANEIVAAKNLDANLLHQRLQNASKIPERVQIVSLGFRRNADVIVAVLKRANGICERCKKNAPFNRKSDGTPFLEVHHRKTLAEGGEDTVENAIALCPNCHREAHYG
ncbi:MAG: HNH endonuclease [Limisphaerales bacterium]